VTGTVHRPGSEGNPADLFIAPLLAHDVASPEAVMVVRGSIREDWRIAVGRKIDAAQVYKIDPLKRYV
jgi:hypothetical protein